MVDGHKALEFGPRTPSSSLLAPLLCSLPCPFSCEEEKRRAAASGLRAVDFSLLYFPEPANLSFKSAQTTRPHEELPLFVFSHPNTETREQVYLRLWPYLHPV